MQTTITEYESRPCSKCGGAGFLSAFQYRKGGECFRCGASGKDPVMRPVVREMTDAEVLDALAQAGFPVLWTERPDTGDWMQDLFLSDEEASQRAAAMQGARLFLAAL
jgi:hypothetical protein